MSTMIDRTNPVAFLSSTLFTVSEAAWASDAPVSLVNKEIDKKIIYARQGRMRLLDRPDLSYLLVVRELQALMAVQLRKIIHHELRKAIQGGKKQQISINRWELPLDAILLEIDGRIQRIKAARSVVEFNPKIKIGDPVVRGTRVPVRLIGEMSRRGARARELATEYELSPEQVELAILFDQLHPRRGRPTQNQVDDTLSDIGDVVRAEIDVLGECPTS